MNKIKILILLISLSISAKAGTFSGLTYQRNVEILIDQEFTDEEQVNIQEAVNQLNDLGLPISFFSIGATDQNVEPSNEIPYLKRDRILIYKYQIDQFTAGRTINQSLPTTKEILYSVVQINPNAVRNQFDFKRIVLHELGHAIGLSHSGLPYERQFYPIMFTYRGSGLDNAFTHDDKAGAWTAYDMTVNNSIFIITDTLCDWILIRNVRKPEYSVALKPNLFTAYTTGIVDGRYKFVCLKSGKKIKSGIFSIFNSGDFTFKTRS
jgi:hypothetical protein